MQTTLNIDDELMRRLKHIAADTKRTLTAVVDDLLRRNLVQPRDRNRPKRLRLPVHHGGLAAGVNADRNGELLDVIDKGLSKEKQR